MVKSVTEMEIGVKICLEYVIYKLEIRGQNKTEFISIYLYL